MVMIGFESKPQCSFPSFVFGELTCTTGENPWHCQVTFHFQKTPRDNCGISVGDAAFRCKAVEAIVGLGVNLTWVKTTERLGLHFSGAK